MVGVTVNPARFGDVDRQLAAKTGHREVGNLYTFFICLKNSEHALEYLSRRFIELVPIGIYTYCVFSLKYYNFN